MRVIVRRSARAVLIDGDELVLIRRTRPGRAPYCVTVGGGVEADDASVEDALHREVYEELGGTLSHAQLIYLITDELEAHIGVQYIYAACLQNMDLAARTGTEFSKPERGGYEVIRVPFTADSVRAMNVMPPPLAEFIAANVEAITSALGTLIRRA